MKERRQLQRWRFSIPCRFQWNGEIVNGRVANLSYGGLCIRDVDRVPAEGEKIQVELELGRRYCCLLKARVVHGQPEHRRFGVEFSSPLEEFESELFPFVQAAREEDRAG